MIARGILWRGTGRVNYVFEASAGSAEGFWKAQPVGLALRLGEKRTWDPSSERVLSADCDSSLTMTKNLHGPVGIAFLPRPHARYQPRGRDASRLGGREDEHEHEAGPTGPDWLRRQGPGNSTHLDRPAVATELGLDFLHNVHSFAPADSRIGARQSGRRQLSGQPSAQR